MSGRYDRYGERLVGDEEPEMLAWQRIRPLADQRRIPDVVVAGSGCGSLICDLCRTRLLPNNISGICAECRLVIRNRLGVKISEQWMPAFELDDHIVSDRGRVARLLALDTSHHYLRVNVNGVKRYVHQMVCEAFSGRRPPGQVARHLDDVPENCAAENLAWGTHAQNVEDRIRNARQRPCQLDRHKMKDEHNA
ncbi:HNH endonuclease [Mycobacterium intermedium]|uniref:HNH endonuclease n=1 Tax=Mycobacterium intermedium TaxID=28445 RepID=A0A1E3SDP9_MYCIE|nr:HNH endonuclease signature motif containing protein [Mycobacterium intermedium]MCV6966035.1 HNH endonuclease [Mycobacterium intermedium]ODR00296.1 hypothetical protein BHQ20_13105 [Mycobacterium intermedium]OPE45137.1 HNH endonuclease [Mycobacterium intermedium]ORB01895.1 HNH endonuclease [Mycobacterium intermedium]